MAAADQHPSHDMAEGERVLKEIYETLRASPNWNETLLIVTYDEHGGFYDNVPTPLHGTSTGVSLSELLIGDYRCP